MKIVARGGKKEERNFGRSGGGLSGGGLSSGGGFTAERGPAFGVSGSVQVFLDENRNKTKTK